MSALIAVAQFIFDVILEALRLVRRLENGAQALPALHRYAISEPLT